MTQLYEVKQRSAGCLAALFTVAALSSACTQKWYLSITSVIDGIPEFCVSDTPWCGSAGHQLSFLALHEVDSQGRPVTVVWSLQGQSNASQDYILKRLRYGTVPTGWVERHPPAALREKVFYSFNDEFYFQLLGAGKSRVYSREEFFNRNRQAH